MADGNSQWIQLLSNKMIFCIALAIWMSTSAMAILEPLLPIWLISHLRPKKWQLGTIFIPDSLGYFIGTNFFGTFSFRVGQIKISVLALMVVGISCIIIPETKSVSSLIIPHFFLGLGIGVLDTSLVPYLARLADSITQKNDDSCEENEAPSNYGSVYAIQQTAVSLAYSIVPFMAGEMVESMGFRAILRTLGVCNFIYGPLLLFITIKHNLNVSKFFNGLVQYMLIMEKKSFQSMTEKQPDLLLKETNPSNYRRFYNSIE
jgi:DHA1 family solute carrier family 18 vesicular amine transporter 1/2